MVTAPPQALESAATPPPKVVDAAPVAADAKPSVLKPDTEAGTPSPAASPTAGPTSDLTSQEVPAIAGRTIFENSRVDYPTEDQGEALLSGNGQPHGERRQWA
jgi:hypothetical protein